MTYFGKMNFSLAGFLGVRHIQIGLMFLLTGITYSMRVNLSMVIVAMTEKTSPNPDVPVYDWKIKNVVLSSFMWGYVLPQIIAGGIGKNYGTKYILMTVMIVNSISCLLMPTMASYGPYAVIGCRVVEGFLQGFIFPSIHNLLAVWSPVNERGRMGTITIAGSIFGTVITSPLMGIISASWWGWPYTFYCFGAGGFIWALLYLILGADCPAKSHLISEKEREYIEASIEDQVDGKIPSVPWVKIMLSGPVWAITLCFLFQNFANAVVFTEMPTYMFKILGIGIQSSGILSAGPYTASMIVALCSGPISDFLINNKYLSVTASRKIFTIIGCVVPAAALTILGCLPEGYTGVAILMFVIAEGIGSFCLAGFLINLIDISPNYCGVLMGISNTVGSLASIFPPLLVQYIVTDEEDRSQWRTIFIISAAPLALAAIFFGILASGKVQKWNAVDEVGSANPDKYDNIFIPRVHLNSSTCS